MVLQQTFNNNSGLNRHRNNFHVQDAWWSCGNLTHQTAFFLDSSIIPPDVCGYCSEKFSNDPYPDWHARILHLFNVHKFGKCNQSKKVYRGDALQSHLLAAHTGLKGMWLSYLVSAAKKMQEQEKKEKEAEEEGEDDEDEWEGFGLDENDDEEREGLGSDKEDEVDDDEGT